MINSKAISAGVTFIASAFVLLVGHTALTKDADATAHGPVIDQLVGGWSLVSRVTTGADGRVLTDAGLSATPSGILIYDRAGHVAAQLSRPGRSIAMLADECRDDEKVRGTENNTQYLLGYDAYFGTYTVNEKEGIVTHHLESALFPGDIGKSIARRFSISGDTLTINFNTTLRDGTPVTRTLVWTRLK